MHDHKQKVHVDIFKITWEEKANLKIKSVVENHKHIERL